MYRESHATGWQIKYTPSFPGWISRVPAHTCTVSEWWRRRPSTPSHLIHPFDRSSNPIRLDTMQPCSAVEHRTVQHSSCGHIHAILQPARALTPAPIQMLTCGYVGLNRCSTADARPTLRAQHVVIPRTVYHACVDGYFGTESLLAAIAAADAISCIQRHDREICIPSIPVN